MTPNEVIALVSSVLPEYATQARLPEPLSGGLINEVWRVYGHQNLILKHTPPFIASAPHVELSDSRMMFALKALQWVHAHKMTQPDAFVQSSRVVAQLIASSCLIFEDFGDGLDLEMALKQGTHVKHANLWGKHLGAFIGQLHAMSWKNPSLAVEMNNQGIQATRFGVQYGGYAQWGSRDYLSENPRSAAMAADLGFRLWANPGVCLVMGDLWPRSVLIRDEGLRIIDWEMSHFGQPGQDVGHLLAHLYLIAAQLDGADQIAVQNCAQAFVFAYKQQLEKQAVRWTIPMLKDATRHMGLEMLIRIIGPFSESYGMDNVASDRLDVLIQNAQQMISTGRFDSPMTMLV